MVGRRRIDALLPPSSDTVAVDQIPSSRVNASEKEQQKEKESDYRRVWICERCTFENEDTTEDARCDACGSRKPRHSQRTRLTLAQQLGLVLPLALFTLFHATDAQLDHLARLVL